MAVHDHKCNYCNNQAYAKNGIGLDRVFLCFNHWKNRKAKEWTKNQNDAKKEVVKKTGSTNKDFLMPLIQKAPNNCQCCGESLSYWKKTNNPLNVLGVITYDLNSGISNSFEFSNLKRGLFYNDCFYFY